MLGILESERKRPRPIVNLHELNLFFTNLPVSYNHSHYVFSSSQFSPATVHVFSFCTVPNLDDIKVVAKVKSGAVGADSMPIRFIKDLHPVTLPFVPSMEG